MKEFIPSRTYIPVSGVTISDDDVEVLHQIVDTRWYTEHTWSRKFAKELKRVCDKKYCVLVNSGSSASLIAISTVAEMSKMDEDYIVTCAMGFPTTVSPIYQVGKIPIYIDIEPTTLAPNMKQLEQAMMKYREKIAGVVLTHNLGFPFNEGRVREIIGDKFFIADCCDALGAYEVGKKADMMTLSFFPAHHITTGEGGAVLTNNQRMYDTARSYANWGRSCYCLPGQVNTCGKRFTWETDKLPDGYDHKYIFDRLGYNQKMTEFQAGLGWSQIQELQDIRECRKANVTYLYNNLAKYRSYLIFPTITFNISNPFGFPIIVRENDKFDAAELIEFLELNKILTRRFFGGNLTKQPAFQNMPYKTVGGLVGATEIMENGFWIGCHFRHPQTRQILDYVIDMFDRFFREMGA